MRYKPYGGGNYNNNNNKDSNAPWGGFHINNNNGGYGGAEEATMTVLMLHGENAIIMLDITEVIITMVK